MAQNRLALPGKENVSVGHRRHPLSGQLGDPTDAYLYHGNDGIALSREAPAARPNSEIATRCVERFFGYGSLTLLFGPKDFDTWGRSEDLAEVVHPVSSAVGGSHAAVAKLVELIKVRQLYLEFQSGSPTLAPRQRHTNNGVERALVCRVP